MPKQLDAEVTVREILPDEERAVRDFLERNLNPIDGLFFSLGFGDALRSARKQLGTSLVAECEGRIVGSFSLKIVVYGSRRIGLIDAIVTDKRLRGRGIGKALLDYALVWLDKKNCEIVCATVDRFNSPSWNLFIHNGFSPYALMRQLRDLGLNFIRLWVTEFYILGGGTFFLKKIGDGDPLLKGAGESWHFLAAWFGFALMLCVNAFRQGAPLIVPFALGVAGLSIFAHEFGHRLAARRLGLATTFRIWDSGILFGSFLTALGALYPSYGSTYVKQVDWRYDPKRKETGLIYAAGPAVSLVLAALLWVSLPHLPNEWATFGRLGFVANYVMVLFNLIPIRAAGGFAWDGGKIYSWNKIAWALLVVVLALLIVGDVLF